MKEVLAAILFFCFLAAAAGFSYWEYFWRAETSPKESVLASGPKPDSGKAGSPIPNSGSGQKFGRGLSETGTAPGNGWAVTFGAELRNLLGRHDSDAYLNEDGLLNRIVVSITNEDTRQMPADLLPWRKLKGRFYVDRKPDGTYIYSEKNLSRYRPLLALVESLSSKTLVQIYSHFYSSFQSEYEEAGGKGYFNDRVVEAIDDVLKAPEIPFPVELQPKGLNFRFVDDRWEGLDAGQKVLARMGAENSKEIKSKLQEIRGFLTKLGRN